MLLRWKAKKRAEISVNVYYVTCCYAAEISVIVYYVICCYAAEISRIVYYVTCCYAAEISVSFQRRWIVYYVTCSMWNLMKKSIPSNLSAKSDLLMVFNITRDTRAWQWRCIRKNADCQLITVHALQRWRWKAKKRGITSPKFFQDFQSSNQHGTVVKSPFLLKKRSFYGHGFNRSGGIFMYIIYISHILSIYKNMGMLMIMPTSSQPPALLSRGRNCCGHVGISNVRTVRVGSVGMVAVGTVWRGERQDWWVLNGLAWFSYV